jgi:hypothetical protein
MARGRDKNPKAGNTRPPVATGKFPYSKFRVKVNLPDRAHIPLLAAHHRPAGDTPGKEEPAMKITARAPDAPFDTYL